MEESRTSTETIDIASTIEKLADIERFIDNICEQYKVNEDFYGNILISLTEAVNNAIRHGNGGNPDLRVKVDFALEGKEMIFTVRDQGKGFDHESLPDPTDPENIEKPDGRGVFLIQNLSDGVEFSDNGSTVEMRFKLTS